MTRLILASTSRWRKRMLENAGLKFDAMPPLLDEAAYKEGLRADGLPARDIADALAEAKALKLSARHPDALVIGGDQVLALENGDMLDKPCDPSEAKAQLGRLSGCSHRLFSAVVVAQGGAPVWRNIDTVRLHIRPLGPEFIDAYVARNWEQIRHCVGCYQIEGEGAQLFTRIEGDHFAIMGLPLLPLLAFLRDRKEMPS